MWRLLRTQDSLGSVRYYAKPSWWNFWKSPQLLGYNDKHVTHYRDIIAKYNTKTLTKEYV